MFADGNELDFCDSHYSSAIKWEFDLTFYRGRLGDVHSQAQLHFSSDKLPLGGTLKTEPVTRGLVGKKGKVRS